MSEHVVQLGEQPSWLVINNPYRSRSLQESRAVMPKDELGEDIRSMNRNDWDEQSTRRMIELFDGGMKIEDIAEVIGRTAKSIRSKRNRLKVKGVI